MARTVWAKAGAFDALTVPITVTMMTDTYPWWPAVIFEEDDEDVPKTVLKAKDPQKAGDGQLQLVRFFDKRSSWSVCRAKCQSGTKMSLTGSGWGLIGCRC